MWAKFIIFLNWNRELFPGNLCWILLSVKPKYPTRLTVLFDLTPSNLTYLEQYPQNIFVLMPEFYITSVIFTQITHIQKAHESSWLDGICWLTDDEMCTAHPSIRCAWRVRIFLAHFIQPQCSFTLFEWLEKFN